jgi:hypothetical protein
LAAAATLKQKAESKSQADRLAFCICIGTFCLWQDGRLFSLG